MGRGWRGEGGEPDSLCLKAVESLSFTFKIFFFSFINNPSLCIMPIKGDIGTIMVTGRSQWDFVGSMSDGLTTETSTSRDGLLRWGEHTKGQGTQRRYYFLVLPKHDDSTTRRRLSDHCGMVGDFATSQLLSHDEDDFDKTTLRMRAFQQASEAL